MMNSVSFASQAGPQPQGVNKRVLSPSLSFGEAVEDVSRFGASSSFSLEELEAISQRGWKDAFKAGLKTMKPFFTDWRLTGQASQVIFAGTIFGIVSTALSLTPPLAIIAIPTSIASLAALYLAFDFIQGFGHERELQNKAREIINPSEKTENKKN